MTYTSYSGRDERPAKSVYSHRLFVCAIVVFSSIGAPKGIGQELARFDYDRWSMILTVPVQVDGDDYWFMLDTGTNISVFDLSLRAKLGSPIANLEMNTPSSRFSTSVFTAPSGRIGDLPFGNNPVICIDLANVQLSARRKISGIVGMDFLQNYIVRIDPDNSVITFLQPTTNVVSMWGERFPVTYDRGLPYITASINGTNAIPFMLDLGMCSTASMSYKDLAPRYIGHEDRWEIAGWTWLVHGNRAQDEREKQLVLRAESLAIGGYAHKELLIYSSTKSSLGLLFLTRYQVTLDFPHDRLYLRPAQRYADYDRSNLDGMSVRPDSMGRVIVSFVYLKSPIGRAGMRTNDVITSIDGQDIQESSFSWVVQYLTLTTDRDVALKVKRGNRDIRIILPAGKQAAQLR